MRILILNWRDIKNPSSGGAEILTHEIAKRLVEKGNSVTQFSSQFDGGLKEEEIDGVKIIRGGNPDIRYLFFSVQFLAFWFYQKEFKGKLDVIIDEIHGVPFFTPLYIKEKKVVLICEVAGELWREMFGPFFGLLGQILEKFYLRVLYKNIPYMTISKSSKDELIKNKVKEKNITVLPMGISIPKNMGVSQKEKNPTLLYVGRLSKPKGIEDAIIMLSIVGKQIANVKLWVVGRGKEQYINHLKRLCQKFGITDKITFFGYVSDETKFKLMGKAHILVVPSIKEGWGLTVPEAAIVGTPAVVYNSAGLKDVLRGNSIGVVVKTNNPSNLAQEVIMLFKNKKLYANAVRQLVIFKKNVGWDNTVRSVLDVLQNTND